MTDTAAGTTPTMSQSSLFILLQLDETWIDLLHRFLALYPESLYF